jgi:hypothetical protein
MVLDYPPQQRPGHEIRAHRVVEAPMSGTTEYGVRESKLINVSQTLKLGRVDDRYRERA